MSCANDSAYEARGKLIKYTAAHMKALRRQPVLERAVLVCKQNNIFRYRGSRAGRSVRERKQRQQHKKHYQQPSIKATVTHVFMLLNARSICNKGNELELLLSTHHPSFLGITETWLRPGTPDSIIHPGTYAAHRTDREEGRGGGVCLLVRRDWMSKDLRGGQGAPKGMEINSTRIRKDGMPRNTTGIIIHTIYVKPGLPTTQRKTIQEHISRVLDSTRQQHPNDKMLVWGDFNQLPMYALATCCGLRNVVGFPTRGEAKLDQIWTNLNVQETHSLPPIGDSDHLIVEGTVVLTWENDSKQKRHRWIRPHPQRAIDACGAYLATYDWTFLREKGKLDDKTDYFGQLMHDVNDHFFAKKKIKLMPTSKPWVTEEIGALIKARKKAHSKNQHEECKRLGKEVRQAITQAKKTHYTQAIKPLRTAKPRRWWKEVRDFGGCPALKKTHEIADLDAINKGFVRQGYSNPEDYTGERNTPILKEVTENEKLEEFEVSRMLQGIDVRKSQPLYDIPSYLLKQFHVELAKPVAMIFNQSLAEAAIPRSCSTVEILPIPKNKNEPVQYRPIVRLPILLKVLERFVASVLRGAMRGKIDPRQYGGQPQLSCAHYLVTILHAIFSALEEKKIVRLQTLDLAKAFDSTEHNLLLTKLDPINLKNQIYNWIAVFLTQLSQSVRLTGSQVITEPLPITRGVLQGSSMAPSLFTVHLNDMPEGTNHWGWVDDLSTLGIGDDIHAATEDSQLHLDAITEWTEQNGLRMNSEKSHDMLISNSKNTDTADVPSLYVQGKPITQSTELKILGVRVQNNLRWESQVDAIVKKCNSRMFLLNELAANTCDSTTDLIQLYTSLIRSVLEYATPAWGLSLPAKDSKRIENIQKRALTRITKLWSADYETLLDQLGLKTLEERREGSATKLARAMVSTGRFRDIFPQTQNQATGVTTRNSNHLSTIRYRTEKMRRSPIPTMARLYNEWVGSSTS